ncbi:hypothetical protein PoB_001689000 [Plakobranchus ocellatus]|uniref:Uncharacterized protein n=1 Tax=Plakobranchus ocellatus TaxID=259542 RepID=A0AAV3Z748_9GAST|nr:hypothetical protein PoB_001689000 [Plakobranchus ocellatus]
MRRGKAEGVKGQVDLAGAKSGNLEELIAFLLYDFELFARVGPIFYTRWQSAHRRDLSVKEDTCGIIFLESGTYSTRMGQIRQLLRYKFTLRKSRTYLSERALCDCCLRFSSFSL